jgi:hypothetical protein
VCSGIAEALDERRIELRRTETGISGDGHAGRPENVRHYQADSADKPGIEVVRIDAADVIGLYYVGTRMLHERPPQSNQF